MSEIQIFRVVATALRRLARIKNLDKRLAWRMGQLSHEMNIYAQELEKSS